jgi:hypothetical protein
MMSVAASPTAIRGKTMFGILKNEVVQYFGIGFALGAAALFVAQPQDARAEILEDLSLDSAVEHLASVTTLASKS